MHHKQVEGFIIFLSTLSIVTLLLRALPVLFVLYFVLGFACFLFLMGYVFEVFYVGRWYIAMPDDLSILGLLFVCIKSVMSCVLLFS